MKNIGIINKIAQVYYQFTALAQAATQEFELQQFEKIKNLHNKFLSLNKDSDINTITSLFDTFNKTYNYLKNETFNPTIKHALQPLQKEVYDIYEKVILEKLKIIHDKYALMYDAVDAENISSNIKEFMKLMGEFNSAVAGLNEINDNTTLKITIAPLYKEVRNIYEKVIEFYESSTGSKIEFLETEEENESEDIRTDQELLAELKDLENTYLIEAANTNDMNIDENIHSLTDIYEDIYLTMRKIQKNGDRNSIALAKITHDRIAKMHSEYVGDADVHVLGGPAEQAKTEAEIRKKQELKQKSEIREGYRKKMPKERYKDFLIEFNSKSPEEQKAIREKWYENSLKYIQSEKGQEARKKAIKNYNKSDKAKEAKKRFRQKQKEKRQEIKNKKREEQIASLKNFFKS